MPDDFGERLGMGVAGQMAAPFEHDHATSRQLVLDCFGALQGNGPIPFATDQKNRLANGRQERAQIEAMQPHGLMTKRGQARLACPGQECEPDLRRLAAKRFAVDQIQDFRPLGYPRGGSRKETRKRRQPALGPAKWAIDKRPLQDRSRQPLGALSKSRQRHRATERGAEDIGALCPQMIQQRPQIRHQMLVPVAPQARTVVVAVGQVIGDAAEMGRQMRAG